ncbi:MAG: hypothetical protein JRD89_01935 [Deltaproteobacteria bacterium]|nr:hypothetical protein [Deltaproteobacteria bacterium]
MTPEEYRNEIAKLLKQSIENLEARFPELGELHEEIDGDDKNLSLEQKANKILGTIDRIRLRTIAESN